MLVMIRDPQENVGVHLRFAQIEEAVGEAHVPPVPGSSGKMLKGKRLGRAQKLSICYANFDFAGRHRRIYSSLVARDNSAVDADYGFLW